MIARAVPPLAMVLSAGFAQAEGGTRPVPVQDGLAFFGETCIDTLPGFEGAGAGPIGAEIVREVEPALWVDRMRALSFALPAGADGRTFCSVTFLSADGAGETTAARDAYFGSGERNARDASLRHTTLIEDTLVDFVTLVDDRGERGVFVRLQAHPVPEKPSDTKD